MKVFKTVVMISFKLEGLVDFQNCSFYSDMQGAWAVEACTPYV